MLRSGLLQSSRRFWRAALSNQQCFYGSSLSDQFKDAQQRVTGLSEAPDNAAKLQLYALFKQASIGKCNAKKPGMMDPVGKFKWNAWNDLGDLSQDDARQKYVDLVNELVAADPGAGAQAGAGKVENVSEFILNQTDGKVFNIIVNRPDKKNALTQQANEFLYFGTKLTAAEACERGLITTVLPDATFAEETAAKLQAYSKLPPQSMQASKKLMRDLIRDELHQANKAECDLLERLWQGEECATAVANFFSRR